MSLRRNSFNFENTLFWIPYQRLKWYGIEPFEETEASKLKIYGDDCKCEFNVAKDFKCNCGWNDNITLEEHRSFQGFRLVSKLGIHGQPNMTFDSRYKSQGIHESLPKLDSDYYTM